MRAIARDGAAVVYTTHYLDEAERLCDRVGIIDHGAILAEGSLAELRLAAGEREIIALRGAFHPEALAGLALPGEIAVIKAGEAELLFGVSGGERQLPALLAKAASLGEVREVVLKQPSLESLFIKLTGRELRE